LFPRLRQQSECNLSIDGHELKPQIHHSWCFTLFSLLVLGKPKKHMLINCFASVRKQRGIAGARRVRPSVVAAGRHTSVKVQHENNNCTRLKAKQSAHASNLAPGTSNAGKEGSGF